MGIGIFGAGGFTRQIIDMLPGDAVILTDDGGADLHGFPVLRFDDAPDCDLVIAISDPTLRRQVALRWRHGFGSLVATTAEVSQFASIGEGAILCRQAIVESDATVGRHFHANIGARIGHECRIGDFVTVGPGAMICGRCTIGDGVMIGAGAIIHQGLTVGDNAMVGMGAILSKDVPSATSAIGRPARLLGQRERADAT
jgi:sugar O-acyltransferase (sialic acid O-acetyltransferase NeuD family)